jgi:hypothetical protein
MQERMHDADDVSESRWAAHCMLGRSVWSATTSTIRG